MYKKKIGTPLDDTIEQQIKDLLVDVEVEYNVWIEYEWGYLDNK